MQLADQVCTVEQARRLQELGVTASSYFKWYRKDEAGGYQVLAHGEWIGKTVSEIGQMLPAYNVGEMGEMLPKDYYSHKLSPLSDHAPARWWCLYDDHRDECRKCGRSAFRSMTVALAQTEAQSRASLLIYLLEKKRLKPPSNKEIMGSAS